MKSGFIAIAGLPNVGKSSLLNELIGVKVAIVSDKPQTTRNRILAVLTENEHQAVFLDTPGIHQPRTKLGGYMMKAAGDAVDGVDVLMFVVESRGKITDIERAMIEKAGGCKKILVVNKIDIFSQEKQMATVKEFSDLYDFDAVIPVSAKTGKGVDVLKEEIFKLLPEGPAFFPEDELTDQPEKQIAAEFIREQVLYSLSDEVPHGTAVEIERFKERKTASGEDIIDIEAVLFCEKNSHKGIIIGKGGAMLKKISSASRVEMEDFFGCKVYLKIFVKVKENWRDSEIMLKNFGYSDRE